ncbi:zf-HC2 domain-containing protein [Promicromonospora sukumoe]|uniref:zf-HC2 domain-containing protein n=1 Tax=Promicromonospora sukumoe TaxID=88382 RepID=UPI0035E4389E
MKPRALADHAAAREPDQAHPARGRLASRPGCPGHGWYHSGQVPPLVVQGSVLASRRAPGAQEGWSRLATLNRRWATVSALRSALDAVGNGRPNPGDQRHRVIPPECRATRAALSDYLHGLLLPRRQHNLEAHLYACPGCIRAFTDVRTTVWVLKRLSSALVATGHQGGRHRRPER